MIAWIFSRPYEERSIVKSEDERGSVWDLREANEIWNFCPRERESDSSKEMYKNCLGVLSVHLKPMAINLKWDD